MRLIIAVMLLTALAGCDRIRKAKEARRVAFLEHCLNAKFSEDQCKLLLAIKTDVDDAQLDADLANANAAIAHATIMLKR